MPRADVLQFLSHVDGQVGACPLGYLVGGAWVLRAVRERDGRGVALGNQKGPALGFPVSSWGTAAGEFPKGGSIKPPACRIIYLVRAR